MIIGCSFLVIFVIILSNVIIFGQFAVNYNTVFGHEEQIYDDHLNVIVGDGFSTGLEPRPDPLIGLSEKRRYMYYADTRWGGFNNHMLILRSMLQVAADLNATFVLQEDYQLWKYLDLHILKESQDFVNTIDIAEEFGEVLLYQDHGLMCE